MKNTISIGDTTSIKLFLKCRSQDTIVGCGEPVEDHQDTLAMMEFEK
jgi:hypothetical protein